MSFTSRNIFFVGPLPPPVHGFAEINRRMLVRLQKCMDVDVFDVAPRVEGRMFSGIYNIANVLRQLFQFFLIAIRGKGDSLYLPLSGGFRQLIDACFAIVALLCGMRIFVHHHSFAYLNCHPIYAQIVLRLLRNSVHIVLCKRMGALLSVNYTIPKGKLRVISNAAFLNEIEKPNQATALKGKLVLGFLSNITAAKGCFEFLDLMKAASANGLAVEGMMAGPVQAEIKEAFEEAVRRAGCVKHVGAVYGDEKNKFFSQIDVLVFPTRYPNEAEPVTIWEAMGAGVPVISLSRGCISGMVTNEVGWIIHDQDKFVDEGLEKIRYLLANDSALLAMKVAARTEFESAKQRYTNNLDELVAEIIGRENDSSPV